MESNPSYTTSVQTDASGNWQHVIPNTLSTGTHHIIVQDEEGNEQAMVIEVGRSSSATSSIIPTKASSIHSNQFPLILVGPGACLGLVIVGFFIYRLILKGKVNNQPKRKTKK